MCGVAGIWYRRRKSVPAEVSAIAAAMPIRCVIAARTRALFSPMLVLGLRLDIVGCQSLTSLRLAHRR